jgi:hypothetical protein
MTKIRWSVCIRCGYRSEYDPMPCPDCGSYDFAPPDKLLVPTMKWGTYGKDGKGPLVHKELYKCSSNHLVNILLTQTPIIYRTKATIEHILYKREWRILWSTPRGALPLLMNFSWYSEEISSLFKKRLSLGA